MPTTVYSQPLPVRVVTSGGVPVIPVDANGQVVGDATRVVSTPMPVIETDANGAVGTAVYSMPLNVTVVSSGGMYVMGVDSTGTPTGTTIGATSTPLGVELVPDVGIDTGALNWTVNNTTLNASSVSFASLSNSYIHTGGTNGATNTQGQTFTPGTYRFSFTIANFVSANRGILCFLGTPPSGETNAQSAIPTGNGIMTVDAVVAASTTGKNIGMKLQLSNTDTFDLTDISVKRIS